MIDCRAFFSNPRRPPHWDWKTDRCFVVFMIACSDFSITSVIGRQRRADQQNVLAEYNPL
jgi:hypothetical protein